MTTRDPGKSGAKEPVVVVSQPPPRCGTLPSRPSSWITVLVGSRPVSSLLQWFLLPPKFGPLTTAAVNGGLRTSPVDSSISSGAMGTIINKKHPTRPRLPTPSVGIIAA